MAGDDSKGPSKPRPALTWPASTFTLSDVPLVQQEGEGFCDAVQGLVHLCYLWGVEHIFVNQSRDGIGAQIHDSTNAFHSFWLIEASESNLWVQGWCYLVWVWQEQQASACADQFIGCIVFGLPWSIKLNYISMMEMCPLLQADRMQQSLAWELCRLSTSSASPQCRRHYLPARVDMFRAVASTADCWAALCVCSSKNTKPTVAWREKEGDGPFSGFLLRSESRICDNCSLFFFLPF